MTIYRTLIGDDIMGPGFLMFFRRMGRLPMGGPDLFSERRRRQLEEQRRRHAQTEDEVLALLLMTLAANLQ